METGRFCSSRDCHKSPQHVDAKIKSIHASVLFSQTVQAGLAAKSGGGICRDEPGMAYDWYGAYMM